jgi:hypothetical protein
MLETPYKRQAAQVLQECCVSCVKQAEPKLAVCVLRAHVCACIRLPLRVYVRVCARMRLRVRVTRACTT